MGLLRGIWRALLSSREVAVVAAAPSNFMDTLANMDLAYQGSPFVSGPAKASIDLSTMDYAFQGSPFVTYRKTS